MVEMAQRHVPAGRGIRGAVGVEVEDGEVNPHHPAALPDHVKLPIGEIARARSASGRRQPNGGIRISHVINPACDEIGQRTSEDLVLGFT